MSSVSALLNNTVQPWSNIYVQSVNTPTINAGVINATTINGVGGSQLIVSDLSVTDLFTLTTYSNGFLKKAGVGAIISTPSVSQSEVTGLTTRLTNDETNITTLQTNTQNISVNVGTGVSQFANEINTNQYGDGSLTYFGSGTGKNFNNVLSTQSIILGLRTLAANTNTTIRDVLIGHNVCTNATNIQQNVVIGQFGANGLTTGTNNIIIGRGSIPSSNPSNAIILNSDAQTASTNQILIGNTTSTVMNTPSNGLCDIGKTANRYKTIYGNNIDLSGNINAAIGTSNLNTLNVSTVNAGALVSPSLYSGAVNNLSITADSGFGVIIPDNSYGSIITQGSSLIAMTANTYRTMAFTGGVSGNLNLFTADTTNFLLTYTGPRTRVFNVRLNVSQSCSGVSPIITLYISKNNSTTPTSGEYLSQNTNGVVNAVSPLSASGLIQLSTNDTIRFVMRSSISTNLTAVFADMSIISLFN